MSLIDQFEVQFNELSNFRLTDGALDEVQPVELAGVVNQEITRVVNEISPNSRLVEIDLGLSNHDFQRLEPFKNLIVDGLVNLSSKTADLKRYENIDVSEIKIYKDPQIQTGIIRCTPIIEDQEVIQESSIIYYLEINGMKRELENNIYILGRGTEADIQINDSGISRKHVSIEIGEIIILKDLNSTNGTFINDERVTEFSHEDKIIFKAGSSEIKVYREIIWTKPFGLKLLDAQI